MNNTSKYYQRMNDIQAVFASYQKYKLFQIMRDIIDEAEQFQSNEIAELKAKVAELEKPIAKIAILANQLKLAKASTYHNRMGTLIEEITGVSLEKRH